MENYINIYCCTYSDDHGFIGYYFIASDPSTGYIIEMTSRDTFGELIAVFNYFSSQEMVSYLIQKRFYIDGRERIENETDKTLDVAENYDNGYECHTLDIISKEKIECKE